MSNIEIKKIKLKIAKAETAKMELEVRIEERKEDIKRMEDHIKLQDEAIAEAKKELQNLT